MAHTLWRRGLSASAEWEPDPALTAVVAYMREDYGEWNCADPMVELSWYDHPAPLPRPAPSGKQLCRLFIIRHPERGFYFEFNDYIGRTPGECLVAIDQASGREEWVPNMSNGEEAFFLAACFMSPAASERVVADFVATQEPSATVAWVPFEPLCPRRDQPPRRKRGRA